MMRRTARTARQHDTVGSAKLATDATQWHEYSPGQRVMTIDGAGRVAAISDGPFAGSENYHIVLEGGLGQGDYSPGQITAVLPTQASTGHVASDDYPELGTILHDRPDPASLRYTASYTPPGWEGAQGPFTSEYGLPHVYARDVHSGAGNCVCGAGLHDGLHLQAAPGVEMPERTAATLPDNHPDKVYLRFGRWPKNERSQNNVTGHPEEGVSVYDLDHHGEPVDPDVGLDRWHEHDSSCEPYCDLDEANEEYGNDTREEMEGRRARAERARYQGRDNQSDAAHLVKGTMVGVGHDGEPLLNNVQRVGDWIDHRHLFIPGAESHRLARDPGDEDYEPPTMTKHADLTGQGDPGSSMTPGGSAVDDNHEQFAPNGYNETIYHRRDDEPVQVPAHVVAHYRHVDPFDGDDEEMHDHLVRGHGLHPEEVVPEHLHEQHADEHRDEGYSIPFELSHEHAASPVSYEPPEFDAMSEMLNPERGGRAAPSDVRREIIPYVNRGYTLTPEQEKGRFPAWHMSSLVITATMDPEFRFHVLASWKDVQAKAKRIRSEGKVNITHADDAMVIGNVEGDHHVYETGLQRVPGRRTSVAHYSCGCKWGAYHWGAPDDMGRFAGRMCSHALALQYEAASRGMFGRDVEVDRAPAKWVPSKVVVKYDIDDGRNMYAKAKLLGVPQQPPMLAALASMIDGDPALPMILSAANDLFGDSPAATTEPSNQVTLSPTTPRNPNENPASAGPLTAPEPKNWGSITTNQLARVSSLIYTAAFWERLASEEQGAEATLHDEPEGALPETDGVTASLGDVETAEGSSLANSPDNTNGEALNPEDQSIQTQGDLSDVNLTGGSGIGGIEGTDPQEMNDDSTEDIVSRASVNDIVEQFQKSAGAQVLMGGGKSGDSGGFDIAAAANAYLSKTAASFSAAERHALIEESPGTQAGNTDRLDIAGTHYAEIEASGHDLDEEGWLA